MANPEVCPLRRKLRGNQNKRARASTSTVLGVSREYVGECEGMYGSIWSTLSI